MASRTPCPGPTRCLVLEEWGYQSKGYHLERPAGAAGWSKSTSWWTVERSPSMYAVIYVPHPGWYQVSFSSACRREDSSWTWCTEFGCTTTYCIWASLRQLEWWRFKSSCANIWMSFSTPINCAHRNVAALKLAGKIWGDRKLLQTSSTSNPCGFFRIEPMLSEIWSHMCSQNTVGTRITTVLS